MIARTLVVVSALSTAFGIYAHIRSVTRDDELAELAPKAKRLDDFCKGTRFALDTAIRELEGTDARAQKASADSIRAESFRLGTMSVQHCLGDKTPNTTSCQPEADYQCLAKQARAYRDALVGAGY